MDYVLLLQIGILFAGIVGAGFTVRYQVSGMAKAYDLHVLENSDQFNMSFNRLDKIIDRVTVIEQSMLNYLDLKDMEERFVTKKELELHLKNIELSQSQQAKDTSRVRDHISRMDDKLDTIVQAVHQFTAK